MSEEAQQPQAPVVALTKADLNGAIEPLSGLPLMTFAELAVKSRFFNVETLSQAIMKIAMGRELGFSAVESLRNIYVHRGHVGLAAAGMASKIAKSGRYDYRLLESTDEKCVLEFLRREPDGSWQARGTSTFTIEEAKRAGLVKPDSGWVNWPADMCFARALSRGQRRFCPDIFAIPIYEKSELFDIKPDELREPKPVEGRVLEALAPPELEPLLNELDWSRAKVVMFMSRYREESVAQLRVRLEDELLRAGKKLPPPPEGEDGVGAEVIPPDPAGDGGAQQELLSVTGAL